MTEKTIAINHLVDVQVSVKKLVEMTRLIGK